jgi:hypothetical protein
MTMVDLDRIVSLLEEQRRAVLDQLEAIDKAIAALRGAPSAEVEQVEAQPPPVPSGTGAPVVPRVVKPKRVLGESHKQALTEGRRKARKAREAAAGLAREMPDESFVPALGARGESQPPRLVKK